MLHIEIVQYRITDISYKFDVFAGTFYHFISQGCGSRFAFSPRNCDYFSLIMIKKYLCLCCYFFSVRENLAVIDRDSRRFDYDIKRFKIIEIIISEDEIEFRIYPERLTEIFEICCQFFYFFHCIKNSDIPWQNSDF